MTMGFDLDEATQGQLMQVVEKMTGCKYLSPDEPSKIPSVQKPKDGIVYGPLKDFPLEADLVLMWLAPSQAMLYSEAAGTCAWTSPNPVSAFGRPACAALPSALNDSEANLSLGCTGMRTFTEISEDKMLAVLPASRLEEFCDSLDSTMAANREMKTFYDGHKAQFA